MQVMDLAGEMLALQLMTRQCLRHLAAAKCPDTKDREAWLAENRKELLRAVECANLDAFSPDEDGAVRRRARDVVIELTESLIA